ncbi:MAG: hypothetical protein WGN25_12185 [Candidatus Electrothrix sp. GW3-4]|uniref:hypothetical protein n=1 Tax=Candidatus Electrothrix sp. GW3-4 TaxID=3126740 RepID=UPI0030CD3E0F
MSDEHDHELAYRLSRLTSIVTIFLAFSLVIILGLIEKQDKDSQSLALIILVMLVSGALGGCLYNLRGIMKHMAHEDFFKHFELTYKLRPLYGAICGVFVFALFYGGLLQLTAVNSSEEKLNSQSIILYLGVALLAGYGSHEFLKKVKDVNKTIFALSESEEKEDKKKMESDL